MHGEPLRCSPPACGVPDHGDVGNVLRPSLAEVVHHASALSTLPHVHKLRDAVTRHVEDVVFVSVGACLRHTPGIVVCVGLRACMQIGEIHTRQTPFAGGEGATDTSTLDNTVVSCSVACWSCKRSNGSVQIFGHQ